MSKHVHGWGIALGAVVGAAIAVAICMAILLPQRKDTQNSQSTVQPVTKGEKSQDTESTAAENARYNEQIKLAIDAINRQSCEEAIQILEPLAESGSDRVEADFLLAWIKVLSNEEEQAEKYLQAVSEKTLKQYADTDEELVECGQAGYTGDVQEYCMVAVYSDDLSELRSWAYDSDLGGVYLAKERVLDGNGKVTTMRLYGEGSHDDYEDYYEETYDDQGRILSKRSSGLAFKMEFAYNDWEHSVKTSVLCMNSEGQFVADWCKEEFMDEKENPIKIVNYDADGNVTDITEIRNEYEYDSQGNILKLTLFDENSRLEGYVDFTYQVENDQKIEKVCRYNLLNSASDTIAITSETEIVTIGNKKTIKHITYDLGRAISSQGSESTIESQHETEQIGQWLTKKSDISSQGGEPAKTYYYYIPKTVLQNLSQNLK